LDVGVVDDVGGVGPSVAGFTDGTGVDDALEGRERGGRVGGWMGGRVGGWMGGWVDDVEGEVAVL